MYQSFRRFIQENQLVSAIIFLIALWLLLNLIQILITLFILYTITTAFLPLIYWLRKRGVPPIIAALIPYLTIFTLIALFSYLFFNYFTNQSQGLLNNFPYYLSRVLGPLHIQFDAAGVRDWIYGNIASNTGGFYGLTSGFFDIAFTIITLGFVTFYLLLDYDRFKSQLVEIFPVKSKRKLEKAITRAEEKLGAWVRGSVVLSTSIGILNLVAYTIIGLPFALPLAFFTALSEFIPTIGPLIGVLPALVVALSLGPSTFVAVLIAYLIVHLLEGNVLAPNIMHRAVGLHPLVVLLGLVVGAKLLGIVGAMISVPLIALFTVLYEDLREV